MVVKVKKLMDSAVLPKYGTEFSAGADLVNVEIAWSLRLAKR